MIEYFENFYFAVPIQIFVTSLFIYYSLMHFKKLGEIKILFYYSVVSLCQCFLVVYISIFTDKNLWELKLIQNSINIFLIIEVACFYVYIIKCITTVLIKRCLQILFIGLISFILYDWISTRSLNKSPSLNTILEGYLIILACLCYYREIFKQPSKIKLNRNPTFWVINGIFLLFAFLISLFIQRKNILFNQLELFNTIYILNYIGYITLFCFFIIGLKWKIKD
jgi:hypothetical protein